MAASLERLPTLLRTRVPTHAPPFLSFLRNVVRPAPATNQRFDIRERLVRREIQVVRTNFNQFCVESTLFIDEKRKKGERK